MHEHIYNWIQVWSKSESEVARLCPTLCNPMDCSLPGFSICGIFQSRILEWVAISFSRRSSRPRDWTQVSHIVGRPFTLWATREANTCIYIYIYHIFFIHWWPLRLLLYLDDCKSCCYEQYIFKPRSPTLQADSLQSEPSGKPQPLYW